MATSGTDTGKMTKQYSVAVVQPMPVDAARKRVPRIMVVVRDDQLRRRLIDHLSRVGFNVTAPLRYTSALAHANCVQADIAIVDLHLHECGRNVFTALRAERELYIIGLNHSPDSPANAFRDGADDTVPITVSANELAARCQALLRRPRRDQTTLSQDSGMVARFGTLIVDLGRRELRVNNHAVAVTKIEFALLSVLCNESPTTTARESLIAAVWGPDWHAADAHNVNVHLCSLHRKLRRHAPNVRFIETIRGVGFRIALEPQGQPLPIGVR